ncbi:DUF3040 domain-containing protein [Actinokineospora pegani]|uniref:DUF3040 domain-containing protein n=1 Tax=Actinokineospora pegani TaxID=2654637 RepID=UPI0018D39EA9|nr:DUF3040 domain-containing protein [Actinokineospora pegani]
MDFAGLSRHEERRLSAIERELDREAPDFVAAFRAASPAHPGARTALVAGAALAAASGLVGSVPLLTVCAMAGAVAALVLPAPTARPERGRPRDEHGPGPEDGTPPGPVLSG